MVLRFLTISFLVGCACAATWSGRLPMKPVELAHKEGCYIKEMNDVIPFGNETTPIGVGCYRIECTRGMLYYASCGVILTSNPDCRITEPDLTKNYPECCPTTHCELANIDNNNIDTKDIAHEDD